MNKKILIIGGVVVAIILIYVIYSYFFSSPNSEDNDSGFLGSVVSIYKDDSFPLKKYSSGKRVEALQRKLNAMIGGWNSVSQEKLEILDLDGKFGSNTESMALKFLNKSQIDEQYFNKEVKQYMI